MGRGIRRRKNKVGMPGLNHLASFENDTAQDLRLVRRTYCVDYTASMPTTGKLSETPKPCRQGTGGIPDMPSYP